MQVVQINVSSTDGSLVPSIMWTKIINIPAPDNANDRILDFEVFLEENLIFLIQANTALRVIDLNTGE